MTQENKTVSESLTKDYGIMGNKSKMIQKYCLENKIPYVDVKAKSITVDDILVPKINQPKKEDK